MDGPTVYYFIADISDESLNEVFDMHMRNTTFRIFIHSLLSPQIIEQNNNHYHRIYYFISYHIIIFGLSYLNILFNIYYITRVGTYCINVLFLFLNI